MSHQLTMSHQFIDQFFVDSLYFWMRSYEYEEKKTMYLKSCADDLYYTSLINRPPIYMLWSISFSAESKCVLAIPLIAPKRDVSPLIDTLSYKLIATNVPDFCMNS